MGRERDTVILGTQHFFEVLSVVFILFEIARPKEWALPKNLIYEPLMLMASLMLLIIYVQQRSKNIIDISKVLVEGKLIDIIYSINSAVNGTDQVEKETTRFSKGEGEAYNTLMDTLRTKKNDIERIRSTVVTVGEYKHAECAAYFSGLYETFFDSAKKPRMDSYVRLIPSMDLNCKADKVIRECLEPLLSDSSYQSTYRDCEINFWFTYGDVDLPFINFTLIDYKEVSCSEVFYGWYVEETTDVQLLDILNSACYVRSTSPTLCKTFANIFDVLEHVPREQGCRNNDGKKHVSFTGYLDNEEETIKGIKELQTEWKARHVK